MPKAQLKVSSSISRRTVSRRNFLLAATAGTAATAAALLVKKEGAGTGATHGGTQSGKGYHVTEHVQNYYRTARI
jgi:hypothetical protein